MREGEGGSSPCGLEAANLQPGAQNEGSAKPNFRAAAVLDEVKGIYNSPLTHGAQGPRAGDIHKEWFPFRKLLPSFRVSAKPSKTEPEVSLWIPSLAHRAVAILCYSLCRHANYWRLGRRLLVLPALLVGLQPRRRCHLLLELEDGPVEHIVVLVPGPDEGLPEQVPKVVVVRLVVKPQAPAVVQVAHELLWKLLAKHLDGRGHLPLADLLVLLLLGRRLEALPRQGPSQEVQQDVTQGLQVVPPALLDPQVRINRGIPRRPRQVLVLPVRNVLVRPWVAVLFGQAKVDDVHLVRLLAQSHQKVIRLDVPVNEGPGVHVLYPPEQLVSQHEHRLEREPPVAKVEEVLQRRTEEIHDHDVVVPLDAVPPHRRDPNPAL
mmetsp:Transcript_10264/g.36488  ORF Transcript_10264/g.36488 Transcript_10264/m.36488 type:complete len:377 (+) Transcript_10264:1-1131(+)